MEHEHDHDHGEEPSPGYQLPDPPEPEEAVEAVTAFLVVQMKDGSSVAFTDVNKPVKLERGATLNDLYAGACQVQRDVTTMMRSAHLTNSVMMAMAQQMQAAQDHMLAQQVMGNGGGGVILPNRQQRRH